MSDSTYLSEPESDVDDSEIEPEDPGEDPVDDSEGATDVPDGEIEDDSGYLSDVSIYTHLDDDAPGPVGLVDDADGGAA